MEYKIMFTKEGLLTISELKLAGKIEAMSDRQFDSYKDMLNTFIDSFPMLADNIRKAVDTKSQPALSKSFSDICDMLDRVHATSLSKDARQKYTTLAGDPDATEAFVEKLILNVSSLSIDIQMSGRRRTAPAAGGGAVAKPSSGAKQIFSAGAGVNTGGRPLILAVDNAVMFLNTIKKLLQNAPYEVHCVTSASEALQFIQSNRPSMFLLDIEMPEMDGYELARRIKGQGQNAPIVFITANSAREYVDKAIQIGADGLLMKPIRGNALLNKVKEFI